MRRRSAAGVLAAILALGALQRATAGDGRREINQQCALAGCFPGDPPGFPVFIEAAGSYVLTSNLTVADPLGAQGISVSLTTADVVIDLNGFEIIGPVTCTGSGAAVSCEPPGGLAGLSGGSHVTVRNGHIRGFGGGGVSLLGSSAIEDISTARNGGKGIQVGSSSVVRRCISHENQAEGIETGAGTRVEHTMANGNGARGILGTGSGVVVVGSWAARNGSDGIATQGGALVQGNVATQNALAGIAVAAGSTVVDNKASENLGNGIYAIENGSSIHGNALRGNGGFGLFLVPGNAGYRGNTLTLNASGTVFGGVSLGANYLCATSSCP